MIPLTFHVVNLTHLSCFGLKVNDAVEDDDSDEAAFPAERGAKKSTLGFFDALEAALGTSFLLRDITA